MMNFIKKLLTLIIIIGFFNFPSPAMAQGRFPDTAFTKYEGSVDRLYDEGIINGYSDGTFRPLNPINRAELLKIVFAALGQNVESHPGNCFPDVKEQWFAPYVCKAKELGIVKGYPDGLFKPENETNLAEAIKIATEAFQLPTEETTVGENWYLKYMEFSHNNNIFSKYGYLPGRSIERGETAFLVDQVMSIKESRSYLTAKRNNFSAGCGSKRPQIVPTKFTVNGIERSAIVSIPGLYDVNKPMPLIFAFHGRTNSNARVRTYYGIEKAADNQAIVIYPAGMPAANGGYSWSDPGDNGDDLRDYELFDVILEEMSNNYCIDLDRIYAVGHSLGAWFTNSLACARGDVLRAVGTLGGGRSSGDCTGPTAAMQWHNPKDGLVPYSQAITARDSFIVQNQCTETTAPIAPSFGNCIAYQGCGDFSPFVWCPHTVDYTNDGSYYTHTWPKNTGSEIWKFFSGLK